MLAAVLKAVKMLLSCCPKNSQDAAVLSALKAVQDAEKNHPHKDQVQRLIPISAGNGLGGQVASPYPSLLLSGGGGDLGICDASSGVCGRGWRRLAVVA
jgi:hypothetical protein